MVCRRCIAIHPTDPSALRPAPSSRQPAPSTVPHGPPAASGKSSIGYPPSAWPSQCGIHRAQVVFGIHRVHGMIGLCNATCNRKEVVIREQVIIGICHCRRTKCDVQQKYTTQVPFVQRIIGMRRLPKGIEKSEPVIFLVGCFRRDWKIQLPEFRSRLLRSRELSNRRSCCG